jgi:GNAT superfamily N-acetyltransferase
MTEMTNSIQPGCFSLIPFSTIECQYVRLNRYVLQTDERGRPVGYLLHGAPRRGQPLVISQHAIDYDHWLTGYGQTAFDTLLQRARLVGCSSIRVRCADDLPALLFWQTLGFRTLRAEPGGRTRQRMIAVMYYPLELPLPSAQKGHEL